jgi:hypothetical protein
MAYLFESSKAVSLVTLFEQDSFSNFQNSGFCTFTGAFPRNKEIDATLPELEDTHLLQQPQRQ